MLSICNLYPFSSTSYLFSVCQKLDDWNFATDSKSKNPVLKGQVFVSTFTHLPFQRDFPRMALKSCFQLSSVCNTRASVLQSFHHHSSSVDMIHFQTFSGLKFNKPSLSFTGRSQKSRLVCKASDAVAQIEVVTEANWDELVVCCDKPVLVDFWAPWCGPCRVIEPVIAELAKEYAGKIACYKLNTDESPNIPTKFGIRSIPTVLFFKNGEKKESIIGAVPKGTIVATIEKYIDA